MAENNSPEKTTVLIVEDDPVQRKLLDGALSKSGYTVLESDKGEVAWQILQEEQIQLIVTDWLMPSLEGPELIRRIRSTSLYGYVYIILLTSKEATDDLVAGLDAGADDYLTKPYNPIELIARISVGERILELERRLKEAQAHLEEIALYDGLTGLMNRRAFYQAAEAELSRSSRMQQPLSMLFIDIDKFKQINDEHGHLVGDDVLKIVAANIKATLRSYDLIGRWGGDEFIAILPGTSSTNARRVAERILRKVSSVEVPTPGGQQVRVQLSLGVGAISPSQSLDMDSLVEKADHSLYAAKAEGGNRVHVF